MTPALTPLHLNQYTREVWSEYDAAAIAIIEPAIASGCYDPKIYKSPDITQEVIPANGYVSHGLRIVPGSLIIGFSFPADFATTEVNVQITDTGLDHRWYTDPVPWYFLSNGKLDMPNLLRAPYPVIEPGVFLIEFWNIQDEEFRTQLQFLCLEPKR